MAHPLGTDGPLELEGVEAKEPCWEDDIVLPRVRPEPVDPATRKLAGACFDDKRRALRRVTVVGSVAFSIFVVAAFAVAREVVAGPVPPPEGPPLAHLAPR